MLDPGYEEHNEYKFDAMVLMFLLHGLTVKLNIACCRIWGRYFGYADN